MGKIKFFSVAMLAAIVALNFTSCSSDDDNNAGSNNVATQKYIIHRTYEYDDGHKYVAVVSYDSKNRPIKIIDSSDSNDEDIISIDWQNYKIYYNHYLDLEFKINEQGFITEITNKDSGKTEFTYSNGVLIKSKFTSYDESIIQSSSETYNWDNGNLTSITSDDGSEKVSFVYGKEINKANIQTYYGAFSNSLSSILTTERWADILVSARLFGNLSRNLPSKISYVSYRDIEASWIDNYTYIFEEDGYVSGVKVSGEEPCLATFIYK